MSKIEDFTGTEMSVVEILDQKISTILAEIEASEVWRIVMSESTDTMLVAATMREIYLEIVMYQPDSIEAAVSAIAQFPRSLPVAMFDEMLHHQVEEFNHGEMALRDYVAMGGDEGYARNRPQSPSSFAVAAVWRNISHKRDPFAYLGAVYLFDALTPIITERVRDSLKRRLGSKGLEFVVHHATADIEHARQIRLLIEDVVRLYPEKATSVINGFDYFAQVYPLPCWSAALNRTTSVVRLTSAAAE